jgi:hypothetical protein
MEFMLSKVSMSKHPKPKHQQINCNYLSLWAKEQDIEEFHRESTATLSQDWKLTIQNHTILLFHSVLGNKYEGENNVFGFDISMNDVIAMHVLNRTTNLLN